MFWEIKIISFSLGIFPPADLLSYILNSTYKCKDVLFRLFFNLPLLPYIPYSSIQKSINLIEVKQIFILFWRRWQAGRTRGGEITHSLNLKKGKLDILNIIDIKYLKRYLQSITNLYSHLLFPWKFHGFAVLKKKCLRWLY